MLSDMLAGDFRRLLPAQKQPVKLIYRQLRPRRPPVVALAGAFGFFHLAQQGVHFRHGEDAAGADGAVAGHGRQQFVAAGGGELGDAVFAQLRN